MTSTRWIKLGLTRVPRCGDFGNHAPSLHQQPSFFGSRKFNPTFHKGDLKDGDMRPQFTMASHLFIYF